ncbi:hypothetical protein FOA52_004115 [Chlamydomonas sp. UWO 241]|nr:hypothetical protein FOA52_004115 [Chlamydomonas sp. UWO 241]
MMQMLSSIMVVGKAFGKRDQAELEMEQQRRATGGTSVHASKATVAAAALECDAALCDVARNGAAVGWFGGTAAAGDAPPLLVVRRIPPAQQQRQQQQQQQQVRGRTGALTRRPALPQQLLRVSGPYT